MSARTPSPPPHPPTHKQLPAPILLQCRGNSVVLFLTFPPSFIRTGPIDGADRRETTRRTPKMPLLLGPGLMYVGGRPHLSPLEGGVPGTDGRLWWEVEGLIGLQAESGHRARGPSGLPPGPH